MSNDKPKFKLRKGLGALRVIIRSVGTLGRTSGDLTGLGWNMGSRERKGSMCGRKPYREAWNELDQDRRKEIMCQGVLGNGKVRIFIPNGGFTF